MALIRGYTFIYLFIMNLVFANKPLYETIFNMTNI